MLELLRSPVEMFTPEPLEVPLLDELELDEFDDEPDDGAEIVMFKNGLRNCQKIASAPLDWKMKREKKSIFVRLFHLIFFALVNITI